ncbi:NADH-quinone oxidoreductase subunit A [Methylacidiphilum caldifontis]|uniref:NADH-quinone oxidoreductase subunit A n=1 Tax=Methylacidiphilum caldifontis TaxID=2795386 RepID=A0A4Y8PAK1_9BACT|nr:NADH-quinone oxidoreductase subunit A [Methylacidiphilum caldifontis]QSR87932.1 NADH-quinone oxidoreductase subunit A [Methylacidiphilum caldifontis]TFE67629.1 NADH-quinone oxidoreductase subunit I [Methylacidiphilum caldifontis]
MNIILFWAQSQPYSEQLSSVAFIFQFLAALAVAVGMLGVSNLIGQKGRRSKEKDIPYECGKDPIGPQAPRFSVKFYMVAMLFILFDIETIFFFVWAVSYKDLLSKGWGALLVILFFLLILGVGFIYEIRKKALDWTQKG